MEKSNRSTGLLSFNRPPWLGWEPLTSYGRLLELVELSLDEAQHQAGLAYSHVPQQHQLELADLGLWQRAIEAAAAPSGAHTDLRR